MVVLLAEVRHVDLGHGVVRQKQDLGLAFQRPTQLQGRYRAAMTASIDKGFRRRGGRRHKSLWHEDQLWHKGKAAGVECSHMRNAGLPLRGLPVTAFVKYMDVNTTIRLSYSATGARQYMVPVFKPQSGRERHVVRVFHLATQGEGNEMARLGQDVVRAGLEPIAEDVPSVIYPDVEIRVLSGRHHGLMGPLSARFDTALVADVILGPDADFVLPVPEAAFAFAYAYDGGLAVGQALIDSGWAGVLEDGDQLPLTAGALGARVLIYAGSVPVTHP